MVGVYLGNFLIFLKIYEDLIYETKCPSVFLFNKKFEQFRLQIRGPRDSKNIEGGWWDLILRPIAVAGCQRTGASLRCEVCSDFTHYRVWQILSCQWPHFHTIFTLHFRMRQAHEPKQTCYVSANNQPLRKCDTSQKWSCDPINKRVIKCSSLIKGTIL